MTINEALHEFEQRLLSCCDKYADISPILYESMQYTIRLGGKRFRPNLMFISAKSLGVDLNLVIDLAIAVELIHTYSLIHDDLPCMDDDSYRRGSLTNHLVYGEAISLLAGDNLQTIAYEFIYNAIKNGAHIDIIAHFSSACRKMVEGQVLDINEEYKDDISKLEQVHLLKTGALIEFCVSAPNYFLNNQNLKTELETVGNNLGIAFQIKDDILDVISSKEVLGKSNSDIKNKKSTYVTLIGIKSSEELLIRKVQVAKSVLVNNNLLTVEFIEILNKSLSREC